MFHLLAILIIGFFGLYYCETHGLVRAGGIIPDVTRIQLPNLNGTGGNNFDYWHKG